MTQRKFKHKKLSWIAKVLHGHDWAYIYQSDDYNAEMIDQILEEYVTRGNDWQEITELELVEGRWYKDKYKNIGRWDGEKTLEGELIFRDAYNQNFGILWTTMVVDLYNDQLKEATTSEIHQDLEAIRIEKGLVEGVEVDQIFDCLPNLRIEKEVKTVYDYPEDQLRIEKDSGIDPDSYVIIYKQGKWATKVKEPVLVTKDNVEIFDGNERLYIPQVDNTIEDFNVNTIMMARNNTRDDAKIVFYHKENARAYIERHKPRFSRADLEFLEDEIHKIARQFVLPNEKVKDKIQNLKQSK